MTEILTEPQTIDDLPLLGSAVGTDKLVISRGGLSRTLALSSIVAYFTDGAPEALDTYLEIVALLEDNQDALAAISAAIAAKLDVLQPLTDIASASTMDIVAVASQNLRVTGTTGVTSYGTAPAGTVRRMVHAAALTITRNATTLETPTAQSIAVKAGDEVVAVSRGSGNWTILSHTPAQAYPSTIRFSANKNNVDQTGLGTSATKLTFTTEVEDVGGYYDAANSRFTPLVAGTYQITCAVLAAGTVTDAGLCQILIYKNGSLFFGGYTRASGTTSVGTSVIKQVPMNGTTDFIEIYYRHNAAGGTVLGDTASTIFEGFLL
jgi:hypothetical protein